MTSTPTARAGAPAKAPVPAKTGPRRAGLGGKRHRVGLGAKLIAIATVLIGWQLLAMSRVAGDSLPTPVKVLQALIGLWGTSDYWTALGTTLRAWAIGLALCAVIGIPVGLILGVSMRATQSTRWIIDFFRTIPTIALLPLVLLLFGASARMEITMIVLAAIWPLLIQSMYAAKQVEPLLKWVVRVFRLSPLDRLRYLWAPSVSLFVSTGMRLAATMALLMAISAEYIGGAPGLGTELSNVEEALRRPEVFAYAFTCAMLGLLINVLVVFIQRRLLWWHPIIRGERAA
ncbi:putative sulfonate ABC transporter, permease [Micromonospora sonchi]|uniref:Sulfonate ABC transporter, permease n=1 Tax=Micromonospora sonchi TaxID=1763543 RepID=A0A917U3W6_9ACTN|nr:ABC transporter permease subunit [Micromonospora sonchi]GGM56023.1 putative sulfonate ABC transporter, permease [Micromonospora sonchi]